ncbi:MAG TPA: amino acid permease, partial [Acidimicrobiales bacterium]|nr:amino acid permease [Acidimicrobiales bacterium]
IALRAFANGASAMTGTEAISNGVSVFRDPQATNARTTLVAMSSILGAMFLGVSALAALTHAVPFASGTPTVISEIGKLVYGTGVGGSVLFFFLQAATAIILILAANTSYTGFPFLVSFVAEDSFLPRQLTERGHRLVFSNGILVLTVAAIVLLVATRAKVASLIPMYAIGVFTGFTMAGAGMVKHHLRLREAQWRRSVLINATAAITCFVVVVVFAVTEFTKGAWVVVVVMPLLVYGLVRLNKQYRAEDIVLEEGAAAAAAEAPILRRHAVVVMVDRLDLATARAIQYARALNPNDLRAVHFAIDQRKTQALIKRWSRLGLSQLPLDVIDTPDRRLGRASLELAADLADGQTEVTMLFPRRTYRQAWSRLLHDRTADRIIEVVSQLPHVNATIVPFNVDARIDAKMATAIIEGPRVARRRGLRRKPTDHDGEAMPTVAGTTAISDLEWRQPARVAGRVRSVRIQPWAGTPALECSLVDASGEVLTIVFLGRREVAGIRTGTKLVVDGVVGSHRGRLAMLNPMYELLGVPEAEEG